MSIELKECLKKIKECPSLTKKNIEKKKYLTNAFGKNGYIKYSRADFLPFMKFRVLKKFVIKSTFRHHKEIEFFRLIKSHCMLRYIHIK